MIDLTAPPSRSETVPDPDRRSFRRRLLLTVGPALAGALVLLGLLAWGGAYVALQRGAVETLRAEADEVEADIVRSDGTLRVGGHTWSEVHHRLADERVDPIFIQVFDRYNRVLRASANIDSLSALYPEQLLAPTPPSDWLPTFRTIEVGGRTLYYLVRPLVHDGTTLGYIQVARTVPHYRSALTTFALGLGGIVVLLFGALLGLVSWAATRVLRPLRRITAFAESITSADLDERIEVPAAADRETALLARTVNDLLDRLEDRFEALRTFTANAAHELQTPLTVLQGHVEIALRRSRSAESYEETLRLLDRRLGTLVRTVRALLTLTRLDGAPAQTEEGDALSTEPVALDAVVTDEAAAARPQAEDKDLRLAVETESAWVEGHPDLLREAIHNLLDNALKYTESGEVRLTVTTEEDRAIFRCRDTGVGIAEADLPHVGGRFYRGSDAGTAASDGSGLGLALVRRIVAAHDGTLRVESTPGEGSRFEIALEAVPAPTSNPAPTHV
jgi:signal transduction histidine kinase